MTGSVWGGGGSVWDLWLHCRQCQPHGQSSMVGIRVVPPAFGLLLGTHPPLVMNVVNYATKMVAWLSGWWEGLLNYSEGVCCWRNCSDVSVRK